MALVHGQNGSQSQNNPKEKSVNKENKYEARGITGQLPFLGSFQLPEP